MKLSRITLRLVLTSVIFGGLISSAIVTFGYQQFSSNFNKFYNSTLNSISETALAVIDADRTEYYKYAEEDEWYEEVNRILNDITAKFDLNFIYVSMVDGVNYDHVTYIYDTVRPGSKWKPYPRAFSEIYVEKSFNESARRIYHTGQPEIRHTLKARSGSHITSMVPVKNAGGKVIAILGVEKDIQEYVDTRRNYLLISIAAAVLITALVVALMIHFSRIQITKPLLLISKETVRFKKEQNLDSGWNSSINTHDEITDLANDVSKMEQDIVDYVVNLTLVTAEKERISTELDVARNIQTGMLPTAYPAFPQRKDFDLYATMIAAREVGGDLYDYLLIDDDHLLIVTGDVSGKGIPASLFMVVTKTLIQTRAVEDLSLSEIAEKTNVQLCKNNDMSMFVTCWMGILTLSTGSLKFINAAHPFPILCHDGKAEFLKSKPDLMFGGMDFTKYQEHTVTLAPGDKLFVYTDGVTEATASNEELFGDERLLKAYSQAQEKSSCAKDTVENVMKSVNEFVNEAPQFDDITMLEFEFKPVQK